MAELFEVFMVVSFGISWPMSILISLKAKTTKGKSLFFLCMILFGYACGITSKLIKGNITYVIAFYILNFFMVGIDIAIYFRNKILDQQVESD